MSDSRSAAAAISVFLALALVAAGARRTGLAGFALRALILLVILSLIALSLLALRLLLAALAPRSAALILFFTVAFLFVWLVLHMFAFVWV